MHCPVKEVNEGEKMSSGKAKSHVAATFKRRQGTADGRGRCRTRPLSGSPCIRAVPRARAVVIIFINIDKARHGWINSDRSEGGREVGIPRVVECFEGAGAGGRQAGRQRGAAWCSTSSAVEFDFIKNAGILCLESASTIIHSQRAVLRRQFPREGRLDSWNSEERTSVLLIEFGFVLRTVANGGLDQGDWTIKSHWRQKNPVGFYLCLNSRKEEKGRLKRANLLPGMAERKRPRNRP